MANMSLYVENIAPFWVFGLLALSIYGCNTIVTRYSESKIPIVGIKSVFEVGLVSNYRFYRDAEAILVEGYNKVRTAIQHFSSILMRA